jgi:hypothetical protein
MYRFQRCELPTESQNRQQIPMRSSEDGEHTPQPVWGTVNYVAGAYSLPRSTIYNGINDGSLESRVVGRTAPKRGRRLILISSVERLIAGSPSRTTPKMRRAMAKIATLAGIVRRANRVRRRRKTTKSGHIPKSLKRGAAR